MAFKKTSFIYFLIKKERMASGTLLNWIRGKLISSAALSKMYMERRMKGVINLAAAPILCIEWNTQGDWQVYDIPIEYFIKGRTYEKKYAETKRTFGWSKRLFTSIGSSYRENTSSSVVVCRLSYTRRPRLHNLNFEWIIQGIWSLNPVYRPHLRDSK